MFTLACGMGSYTLLFLSIFFSNPMLTVGFLAVMMSIGYYIAYQYDSCSKSMQ